jgi:hypothetical protein
MIACEVFCDGFSIHVEQLYTGFAQLYRKGFLRLKQKMCRPPRMSAGMHVCLNGSISLFYDTSDGQAIDAELLRDTDYYFKRSFAEEHCRMSDKIHPLGLNYLVYNDGADWFKIARDLSFGSALVRIRRLVKHLVLGEFPTIKHMEALPDFEQPPRVLMMTRLWSAGNLADPSMDSIEAINRTRAQCIRLLRKELGDRFFGGLAPDDFACQHFGDLVLPEKVCRQGNYLTMLREFPICVATRGLWGSNGFRLGEYVAHSKAIVTERLAYQVPGDFACERNYLEFSTPEECVEATMRLMKDRALRNRLSINNFRYYQAFGRPDSLVLNTLAIALGH